MSLRKSKNAKLNPGVWECTISELITGKQGLSISGNPKITDSPYGKAIWFDGTNDGFFLPDNPLKGLTSFTVETLISPDANGPVEQRFLHIGETDSDRLLVETRINANQWYLDTFILSGESKNALIDPALMHPCGSWYHVVLTLDKTGQMTNYINGKKEITGHVDFKPLNSGEMSIGARRNKVSWYKGAIYKIRISPGVLKPEDFMDFIL
jgi:hypothetical protein